MSGSQPQAKPCPWCGETPDINDPRTFLETDGPKWGALHCCCTGPEVRTNYGSVEEWRDKAIAAWNERAQPERDELLAALRELVKAKDAWVASDHSGETTAFIEWDARYRKAWANARAICLATNKDDK